MSSKLVIPREYSKEIRAMVNGTFPSKPKFTEEQYPKLDGKVVIVTGGSSGLGLEVAKSLLGSTNAKVYIFARDKAKIDKAIKKLQLEVAQEYNKKELNVHSIVIDLSDLTTIKPAAEEFLSKEKRIDIIIHNAGVMTPPLGSKTKQGYELQLGTNNIGPHLLQKFLDPLFIKTSKQNKPGESRIVYVSASAIFHAPKGGIHYADPNFKSTKAEPFEIYAQSKAVNILSAKYWTKAHPEATNVVTVSLCPGFLKTELQRHLVGFEAFMINKLVHKARLGAYTELYAALSPDLTRSKTGSYVESFGKLGKDRSDLDVIAAKKAWEFLDQQVEPYL
ncbi:short-chain alcohol dehydrogenase [Scheffersomyces coipomensis]|uniref:short-chain alcohol dehydrogenase n=1 Tax=Scheffersomyces coipomensis TaxID=1788519 RepID=UPI00315C58F5